MYFSHVDSTRDLIVAKLTLAPCPDLPNMKADNKPEDFVLIAHWVFCSAQTLALGFRAFFPTPTK